MEFFAGDFVRCLKDINFTDNTKHIKGEIYEVKKGEESYYTVNSENYLFVGHIS